MDVRTLIAVPCHDMVHANFMRSLMELDKPAGTGLAVITNTLIYTARNNIAINAIRAGFDRILWLDSDMIFPPDTLKRLSADLDEGREFVCGLYFTRKQPVVPCVQTDLYWNVDEGGTVKTGCKPILDYPDGVFEIDSAGFGCVMTSANLLKCLCERYGAPFYPLMGMGEDTTFCFRAKQAGEKLYCDSRIKCGHIGQTVFDETYYHANK